MKRSAALMACLLVGCAANSGVVKMGDNVYFVSRQAATGFSGAGTLKAQVMREAGDYCSQRGLTVEIISATETTGPYVLGRFPKAEAQFRCVP